MRYSPLIQKAISFAVETHEINQKQKRKGKDIPYITHPLAVGLILASCGSSDEVIAAGILHDTIEDSVTEKKVSEAMLVETFSETVAALVASVSEMDKTLSWNERKQKALEHIATFSHGSILVKSADVISNASEFIADYEKDGEKTFARFNAPKQKLLESHLTVINALLVRWGDSPLTDDLRNVATKLQLMSSAVGLGKVSDLHDIYLGAVETENGWDVKVYLINISNEPRTLQLLQGSFYGDTDGLQDLGHSNYKEVVVPPNGYIQIDHMTDAGELDFTTYYNIRADGHIYLEQINGWSFYEDKLVDIPMLNQTGYFAGFKKMGDSH